MTAAALLKLQMDPPLMGFEDITAYTLHDIPDNPYFFWLAAAAEDGPKFLLTKPEYFFPGYLQQVNSLLLANKECSEGKLPDVYVIITLAEQPLDMTANLLAPLLIDFEKQQAAQMVLYESDYTPRHYLFPPEKRRKSG